MRIKQSARKARQKRDRNRRLAARSATGNRTLRCEPLESRVLLDAGGLFLGAGLPEDGVPLPDPSDPIPPFETGAISGIVWQDTDGDRQQNGNEPGMGGATVYSDLNFNGLLDANEPSTVTSFDDPATDFDEGGLYTLENLQPGYHNVRQITPSGFEQSYPSLPDGYLPPPWGDPSVHVTFVEQGQTVDDVDFGNKKIEPASVHGVKWHDANGNAERDPDELGLPGVIIFSDRNLNGVFDPDEPQTVTSEDDPSTDFDESGQYSLEGLDPGWHWIKEVVPEGYRQTFPNHNFFLFPGIQEGADELIVNPPVGGQAHDVFLQSGQSLEGINFGNQLIVPGSIHGTKWEDLNGDGIRSADEPGLAGVTIYSDTNLNAELDPNEPHTVTMADDPVTDFDESGLYWLHVDSGFHVIREVVPDDFRQTFPVNFFPALQPEEPLVIGILPPQDGAHFVSVEPGQSVANIDFGNQKIKPGSISGVKWGDANGNAEFDPWERGLAGVTVYADRNDNGVLDADEPSAITTADIPETDFDEGGRYTLAGLAAGDYVIREVVPDDFRQTYPLIDLPRPLDDGSDVVADAFATVEPGRLDFILAAGDVFVADVAVTIHPNILLSIEIDVVASSADVNVINLSGPQLNGGGGDTSVFQIMIFSNSVEFKGELQFVDQLGGNAFASIPLTIGLGLSEDGSHRVTLGPGESIEGLNFGNQEILSRTGSISGRKWEDLNGNAEHDPNESGLAGVVIYADLNFNGRLDSNEPSVRTTADIPETDFDEAGLYRLETPAGFQAIREVVPLGYRQTFPTSDAASPSEQGAHFVNVETNGHIDGLDFANQPIDISTGSVSGTKWEDANGNGQRDPNEVGLGGVTIYADLNWNAVFDPDEPHAVTTFDIPETDFDEGGLYSMDDLIPGFHAIREVVPFGFQQTFPISIAASPLEQGAHFVNLEPGDHADFIDFGNQRIEVPLPGDFNNDGVVDDKDLGSWEDGFGGVESLATADVASPGLDGGSFLDWQRNYGKATPKRPVPLSVQETTTATTVESNASVQTLSTVDLKGLPRGSSRGLFAPALRNPFVAREAAFAESSQPNWRTSERVSFSSDSSEQSGESSSASSSRQAESSRGDDFDFVAAVDAALESDFGA